MTYSALEISFLAAAEDICDPDEVTFDSRVNTMMLQHGYTLQQSQMAMALTAEIELIHADGELSMAEIGEQVLRRDPDSLVMTKMRDIVSLYANATRHIITPSQNDPDMAELEDLLGIKDHTPLPISLIEQYEERKAIEAIETILELPKNHESPALRIRNSASKVDNKQPR